MTRPLVLSLITLGDPGKLTGGYLYHQRMAAAAARHGATLDFISVPEQPFLLATLSGRKALARATADRPDALLVDSIAAAFLAPWLLFGRPPRPICGILHQPPGGIDHGPLRSRLQSFLDSLCYRRASLLIVASQLLADEMHARGTPRNRLQVVPPGRDTLEPAAVETAEDMRQGRAAAFLCVANWLPRKGIHTLLEAFAALPPEAGLLHLVGDNRVDRAYTRRIARRLAKPDLRGRVRVHGPVTGVQVAALYAGADVFVLPSTREPYGTVYGEAMAAGLPVIGLRAGNLPNLVTPGVEGLVVEPSDASGLGRAMLALTLDEDLRRRMGEAARRRALGWPTWEESAAAFFRAVRLVAG